MGFFDSLKSAARAVTGGGAEIHVQVDEVRIGEPFTVTVTALANAELKIDAVYVRLRAVEEVRLPAHRVVDRFRGQLGDAVESLTGIDVLDDDEETFDQRLDIAGPQVLQEGETYTWAYEITLPPDARPSFHGHLASHEWKIFAGLDAFGNDPDSGWVDLWVRG